MKHSVINDIYVIGKTVPIWVQFSSDFQETCCVRRYESGNYLEHTNSYQSI